MSRTRHAPYPSVFTIIIPETCTQDHGRYGRHKNRLHTIALFLTGAWANSKVVGTESDESSDVTMNYKDTDLTVEASGGKGTDTSTPCKYE